jgi:hypothetical protein
LTEDELNAKIGRGEPLEFSHTLEKQLGGLTSAGFLIAGFYEDEWQGEAPALDEYFPNFCATLAIKP